MGSLDRIAAITPLAAALCADAGVRVMHHPGQRLASYDPFGRVIHLGVDIDDQEAGVALGLLAHECAHVLVSRYHLLRTETPGAFPDRAALLELLNALEDPRAEHWIITRRYPGVEAWLKRVFESAPLADIKGREARLPCSLLFNVGAVIEPYMSWTSPRTWWPTLPDPVLSALDATRTARQDYTRCVPPAGAAGMDPSALADRHRALVLPRLRRGLETRRFSSWEMLVQISAAEALEIAAAGILPAAAELVRQDLDRIEALLRTDEKHRELARHVVAMRECAGARALVGEAMGRSSHEGHRRSRPLNPGPEARGLLGLLTRKPPGPGMESASPVFLDVDPDEDSDDAPMAASGTRASYDALRARVVDQIEQLVTDFEDVLIPTRAVRRSSGFCSGSRLDMRRALRAAVDPRERTRLFSRLEVPAAPLACVSLLIDCSGSMRNGKIEAALTGAVLLAEALTRLDLPWAAHGFQDELIHVRSLARGPCSAAERRRLEELPLEVSAEREGGHNMPDFNDDGPCLREAAGELLRDGRGQRVLIVISDGAVDGCRSTEEDLEQAIEDLRGRLDLVGVGLGPRTDHVLRYYPHAVAEVPLNRLAPELGRVLRRVMLPGLVGGGLTRRPSSPRSSST